jgi:pyruvate formate lyase activating enzyme
MVLTTYGRSSGFCVDPVEKKPLYHYAPGSAVLSFGTAGCNLACRYCQNWEISAARATDVLTDSAGPEAIAEVAVQFGCRAVAYTYNDPVVFAEYAIDVAEACRDRGVGNIAVTAGYIQPTARADLFAVMDAANIDLKSFSEEFYRRLTGGRLAPVLDTICYAVHEAPTWVELTTLLIPGFNDSPEELTALTGWIAAELGPDVPLHFTAFHPDNRMRQIPRTPVETLLTARRIARDAGLRYVYLGNAPAPEGSATYCPTCSRTVVDRGGFDIVGYDLTGDGCCPGCATPIPGIWDAGPGGFGPRRIPVRIADSCGPTPRQTTP